MYDSFDCQIQPEELQCDNPIDEDFEPWGGEEDDWEEDEDFELED